MSAADNTRREFLEAGLAGTAALGLVGTAAGQQPPGPGCRPGRSARPA